MMCSYLAPKKTVQNITNEIMNALNMHEYPEIPFIISGIQGILIRKFDMFESYIFAKR